MSTLLFPLLAVALLLVAIVPAIPHAMASDRRFAHYLKVRARYRRHVATEAQRMVQLEMKGRGSV